MSPTENQPIWSPDSHLERVYRRGYQLRRRRHVIVATGACAALIAVFGLAADLNGSGPGRRVLTAGGSTAAATASSTATTTTASGSAGPASAVTPSAGAVAPAASSVTTAPASPATTASAGTHTTSPALRPTPTTTVTTPSPVPSNGMCGPAELAYSTATDSTRYSPGQPVTITLVARNISAHPCTAPGFCGISAAAAVTNSAGTQVWRSFPIGITCVSPPPTPPQLNPGQSHAYGAGQWPDANPTGTYSAVASRTTVTGVPVTFTVG